MPALAELQHAMGQALLASDAALRALPATWFRGDATDGLKVHRNTIVGACCAALRLSYPTIERVLGASMFESLAADYARAHPPTAPALDEYGERFAVFMAARAARDDAPLLRELAAYDWIFERVAHAPADQFGLAPIARLEGGMHMYFATSLRLFEARYDVERMRAALASGTAPAELRTLALWRRDAGVGVAVLRAPAAAFVAALLSGQSLEQALSGCAVARDDDAATIANVLAADVFQAGFVRLTPGDVSSANHNGN